MTTWISEIIHGWLGWCPYTQVQVRNAEVRPGDENIISPAGGSFKHRAIHWLGLFHNQIILSSIGSFCAGLYMFAGLGTWSNLNLFIIGILAGLPFSAYIGIWYWEIFNKVLHEGPVVLWNRYDKIMGTLTVVIVAISVSMPVLVIIGAFPGIDLAMTNAFFGGFIAVLFWGMLISLQKWESDTHRLLQYDGMILDLKKEDTHATG